MAEDLADAKAEFRRWIDSTAFRIEVHGRDLLLIPLPEPVDDYVDMEIGRISWHTTTLAG